MNPFRQAKLDYISESTDLSRIRLKRLGGRDASRREPPHPDFKNNEHYMSSYNRVSQYMKGYSDHYAGHAGYQPLKPNSDNEHYMRGYNASSRAQKSPPRPQINESIWAERKQIEDEWNKFKTGFDHGMEGKSAHPNYKNNEHYKQGYKLGSEPSDPMGKHDRKLDHYWYKMAQSKYGKKNYEQMRKNKETYDTGGRSI